MDSVPTPAQNGKTQNEAPASRDVINGQTETKQFKRWLKGSKVVNEDGTPRVMYHLSDSNSIRIFRAGNSAGLIYFAYTAEAARKGARSSRHTYEVYLSVRNPVNTEDTSINWYDAEDAEVENKES